MGDDFLEREQHAFGVTLRSHLAVDPAFHLQIIRITDFVGGHDPRAQHVAAVKALALRGAEPAFHFDALGVAGRKIVEDGEAENVIAGFRRGNVRALALGDDAEFELIVHHAAVARPLHRGVGAANTEAVGDVVDRLLAIDLR